MVQIAVGDSLTHEKTSNWVSLKDLLQDLAWLKNDNKIHSRVLLIASL